MGTVHPKIALRNCIDQILVGISGEIYDFRRPSCTFSNLEKFARFIYTFAADNLLITIILEISHRACCILGTCGPGAERAWILLPTDSYNA